MQVRLPILNERLPERGSVSIDGYASNVASRDEKPIIFTTDRFHFRSYICVKPVTITI